MHQLLSNALLEEQVNVVSVGLCILLETLVLCKNVVRSERLSANVDDAYLRQHTGAS